jgi:hypothetical protein
MSMLPCLSAGCVVSYLSLHVVLLSCVCWFVVVQGKTALIWAASWDKLSVVEILLKAGADVNDRDTRHVCDGDVWDIFRWICSIVYVVSLHFISLHLVFMCSVLFCSVLFLCWYFMSIFMFMFIVCECVISLSCYYLSG